MRTETSAPAPPSRRSRNARKDAHRPAAIAPAGYLHLFSFSLGTHPYNLALMRACQTAEPQQEPVYGVDAFSGRTVIRGYREVTSPWGKLPFFAKVYADGTAGYGCDICGASYKHGDAYLHGPSGEVVLIGHICADKMGCVADRSDWTRNQKMMARLRKDGEYQRRRLELAALRRSDAVNFLAENAGLEAALKADHRICRDLAAKLDQYGRLSPAQVGLAFKLATEMTAPKPDAPPQVTPPPGRQLLTGRVVSLKDVETDFGEVTKMLVEVAAEAGVYRVYGTAPRAILGAGLRGCRVRFCASVQPNEPGFGFFSRPTAAEVLEAAA